MLTRRYLHIRRAFGDYGEKPWSGGGYQRHAAVRYDDWLQLQRLELSFSQSRRGNPTISIRSYERYVDSLEGSVVFESNCITWDGCELHTISYIRMFFPSHYRPHCSIRYCPLHLILILVHLPKLFFTTIFKPSPLTRLLLWPRSPE
jgi:hypothetical protein